MQPAQFTEIIGTITASIAGKPLDAVLERTLNDTIAPGTPAYTAVFAACRQAIDAGWMCNREHGGIKFGRVVRPGVATHGFSVDVVDMSDIAGPHHRHPLGEIDLVMPIDDGALFDGRPAGWVVLPPDSAHRPTVSKGRALVLYLLPQGQIEFTPN